MCARAQTQMFMNIYDKFCSPEFMKYMNLITESNFRDYGEFKKKIVDSPEPTLSPILAFYEGVGTLVSENILDMRLVAKLFGGATLRYWAKLAPYIEQVRVELGYPELAAETEYLCKRLKGYMDEHPDWYDK